MISFRSHVVSLVAVLMALATGIVMGSGPLQGVGPTSETAGETEALLEAQQQADELSAALSLSDDYAAGTVGRVLGSPLKGRAVTLVQLPGADPETVAALARLVRRGGGRVTARVVLTEKLLDPENRALVTELGNQIRSSERRAVRQTRGLEGYELMGALLAQAVTASPPGGETPGDAAESIVAALTAAELVSVQGRLNRRGSLVLVVAGAPYGDEDQQLGAGRILATLLTKADEVSRGVVVAGPLAAAREGGLVRAIRVDPLAAREVSTADGSELVAGTVAAVLALGAEDAGQTGHYGAGAAADGALPDPR